LAGASWPFGFCFLLIDGWLSVAQVECFTSALGRRGGLVTDYAVFAEQGGLALNTELRFPFLANCINQ
jgi:hypothetical protein